MKYKAIIISLLLISPAAYAAVSWKSTCTITQSTKQIELKVQYSLPNARLTWISPMTNTILSNDTGQIIATPQLTTTTVGSPGIYNGTLPYSASIMYNKMYPIHATGKLDISGEKIDFVTDSQCTVK